jgi:hypothetical protein
VDRFAEGDKVRILNCKDGIPADDVGAIVKIDELHFEGDVLVGIVFTSPTEGSGDWYLALANIEVVDPDTPLTVAKAPDTVPWEKVEEEEKKDDPLAYPGDTVVIPDKERAVETSLSGHVGTEWVVKRVERSKGERGRIITVKHGFYIYDDCYVVVKRAEKKEKAT